jgi:hypothetical protein
MENTAASFPLLVSFYPSLSAASLVQVLAEFYPVCRAFVIVLHPKSPIPILQIIQRIPNYPEAKTRPY